MKLFLTILCLCGLTSILAAGFGDLEIHIQPKQTDQSGIKTANGGSAYKSKEHWIYEVSVENKSFKQVDGLEVKYVTFFKRERFGSTDAAKSERQAGSVALGSLKSHEKRSVVTGAVELNKTQLDGDYYFSSGGKEKAQDSLVGCWVKVYQNGQQLAEYANPSTLLKEHWQ